MECDTAYDALNVRCAVLVDLESLQRKFLEADLKMLMVCATASLLLQQHRSSGSYAQYCHQLSLTMQMSRETTIDQISRTPAVGSAEKAQHTL